MNMFALSIRRHLGYWYYSPPIKHISSFLDFINIFLRHVMGDQSIAIHEIILQYSIWKVKDQIIRIWNKAYVAYHDVSILREIQKQNKALQQLRIILGHKISKSQFEDLGGKIVNKEPEPNSHSDTHEFGIRPYIPNEIQKLKSMN